MIYPTKAESFLRSSAPDSDGRSPEPAADATKANTENPIIAGGAAAAKAENTERAEGSPKAGNGLNSTSPDRAKATEILKAENVLMQIAQQAMSNLQKAGIRVTLSEGMLGDQPVIRFSVYGARLCRKCRWVVLGEVCVNPHCAAYGEDLFPRKAEGAL